MMYFVTILEMMHNLSLYIQKHLVRRCDCKVNIEGLIILLQIGDYDKRAISKTTLSTTPNLFRGLIQAIWRKNEQILLKKKPWTLQKTKSGYLGPPITQVAKNKCSSLNLGYFDACKFFIYCFRIFAIFSKTLWLSDTHAWVTILIFYVSGIS